MTAPTVSVIMAVRDGAPWVRAAIESVLAQTLADLELIVVDDGSVDATPAILDELRDARIARDWAPRAGLTAALVRALGRARAPLIARLDADDLALPERLARQLQYLAAYPEVGLLGTAAREVDTAGREVRVVTPPPDDATLRRRLIRGNPFVHSSVMMRREALERAGGYDVTCAVAQDYDLWMRMSRVTRLANLPDVLVVRRLGPDRIGLQRDDERLRTEIRVRWRAVRGGAYPWWDAAFVARPALALAMPGRVRAALRKLAGRS